MTLAFTSKPRSAASEFVSVANQERATVDCDGLAGHRRRGIAREKHDGSGGGDVRAPLQHIGERSCLSTSSVAMPHSAASQTISRSCNADVGVARTDAADADIAAGVRACACGRGNGRSCWLL